jgi:hypothetical protein
MTGISPILKTAKNWFIRYSRLEKSVTDLEAKAFMNNKCPKCWKDTILYNYLEDEIGLIARLEIWYNCNNPECKAKYTGDELRQIRKDLS